MASAERSRRGVLRAMSLALVIGVSFLLGQARFLDQFRDALGARKRVAASASPERKPLLPSLSRPLPDISYPQQPVQLDTAGSSAGIPEQSDLMRSPPPTAAVVPPAHESFAAEGTVPPSGPGAAFEESFPDEQSDIAPEEADRVEEVLDDEEIPDEGMSDDVFPAEEEFEDAEEGEVIDDGVEELGPEEEAEDPAQPVPLS